MVSREASSKFQLRSFENDRFARGFLQISKKSFQNDRFVRGFLQISKKKLRKWSFCARLPPNFKEEASKMIVSCEASSKFQRRRFQNDRFMRGVLQISKEKVPKWWFRARRLPNFTEEASKMMVSCEASFKFHRRSFQNDGFVRGFLQISKKKLPKWSIRARLPPNFTEEASKMMVSCEASSKFHRRSFQNDGFMRGFLQISKKKLPKWLFHARLPPNFKEEASKMIVLREASSKFQSRSFQNDRFARGFLQISKKKLRKWSFCARLPPNFKKKSFQNDRFVRGVLQISKKKLRKWSFCARLPPNFKEEASKMIVLREASSKFLSRSFQNDRFARGFLQISTKKVPKMIVSCEASSKFQRRSFQNDRFVRGFLPISKKKVPKWSFRARLRPNFKGEASKMIVSCEASVQFQRRRFQHDRFVRGLLQISQKKLPKWWFRARLPPNFTEGASKMMASCEASSKFHRRSFQNDRFVRGFLQISKEKLPKWLFHARRPPNFNPEASKMMVSCEASFKFHRRSFQNDGFVRGFLQIWKKKLPKYSFRARLLPNFKQEASKMNVSCDASEQKSKTINFKTNI